MPAQANATVTAVAGAGTPDDWDVAAAAGGAKWQGAARAYYRESRDRVTTGGATPAVSFVTRRELILDNDDVAAMELLEDDVLTFRVDGAGVDSSATAASIPRRDLAGVPRELRTARIILEDL